MLEPFHWRNDLDVHRQGGADFANHGIDTNPRLILLQAAEAAAELRENLDAERAAVIAYWRSVHEDLLKPWQEAAGIVAAWPHTIDSLALCNTLACGAAVLMRKSHMCGCQFVPDDPALDIPAVAGSR